MRRNAQQLAGMSILLAALVVLFWPGSSLALALGAFAIGILLLGCVMLMLRAAQSHTVHSPHARR